MTKSVEYPILYAAHTELRPSKTKIKWKVKIRPRHKETLKCFFFLRRVIIDSFHEDAQCGFKERRHLRYLKLAEAEELSGI